MKRLKRKAIKTVLKIDLTGIKKDIEDPGNLPDIFNLYQELLNQPDIDEDLERTHILYSWCVVLGEEFHEAAENLRADLDAWAGKKWLQYKASPKRKYTDNDAKRKIESRPTYLRMKKRIAMYEKLYKQLTFGGGKALELKGLALRAKLSKKSKIESDFNVRKNVRDLRVSRKIKKHRRKSDA